MINAQTYLFGQSFTKFKYMLLKENQLCLVKTEKSRWIFNYHAAETFIINLLSFEEVLSTSFGCIYYRQHKYNSIFIYFIISLKGKKKYCI